LSVVWRYVLLPAARKDIRRLDRQDREWVFGALDRFIEDVTQGDFRKLQGRRNQWRLRVGDLRVVFTRDEERLEIAVLNVFHRGRGYRA
jgi:mRNA interferase RelE/StbE